MANVGDILTTIESGLRRIDDRFYAFKIINCTQDKISSNFNGTRAVLISKDSKVEFYVYTSKLYIYVDDYVNNRVDNFQVEIDGVVENVIYTNKNVRHNSVLQYKNISLEKKIHHVIISAKDANKSISMTFDCIDIDEDGYMVYCDDNGKLYYDMTPIMTSNNTPAPYVVSASSEHISSNFNGYKAFDGINDNIGYGWAVSNGVHTGSIAINLNKKFNYMMLIPRYNILEQFPKNFDLEGGDDNNSYTIIKKFRNITSENNAINIFNIGNVYKYNYIRLNIFETIGSTDIGLSEIRFLLAVDTPFYLIQDNSTNKIYNYDEENDQLVEVTDISILKENALINTCIYDLNKVKDLIDLTDENITILSNQDAKLIVDGIKNDKELIVSNQNLSIVNSETIYNFLFDIDKVTNGNCKFVISADNGLTWLSWNGSSWDTLTNTATLDSENKIKQYSKLSDSEKIQWNKLRDEIWTNGMNTDIADVDYNSILTNKTIRFAFVLYRPTYDDNVALKDTQWLFDRVGAWHKLSEDDIDIAVNSNMCIVTPKLQNLKSVKVNILI